MQRLAVLLCLSAWALCGCDVEGDVSAERQNVTPDDTMDVSTSPDTTTAEDVFDATDLPDTSETSDAATDPDTITAADTTPPPDTITPSDTSDTSDPPDTVEPPPDPIPARYATDRTLSPLTPHVAAHLREVITRDAKRQAQVFAKVGDSVTVNVNFLHCFTGSNVDLAAYANLQETLDWFASGDAAGSNPFERTSLAATVGWSAFSVLSGVPSALDEETTAIQPRFAVVMFGTNDVEIGDIYGYADDMLDITDNLLAQGIIPILSTIMPRDDDPTSDALVPRYNLALRAIAQARQVPLIDLHRELLPLPDHGLSGDQIHPKVFRAGQGCVFTPEALTAGYNLRNLLTLQSLDRLRRSVLDTETPPDPPEQNPLQGDGSPQNPFVIDSLPFTDTRDTSSGGSDTIDTYTGCNATQNESGTEFFYRLDISQPTTIRAFLFDRGDTDIDLHLLSDTPTASACIARDHRTLSRTLQPGTYHFSLDTFVNTSGDAFDGEYIFIILQE